MAPNLSDAIKNQIVGLHVAGKSVREIMGIMEVARRGVQGVLKRYREEGDVNTKSRSGRPARLFSNQISQGML